MNMRSDDDRMRLIKGRTAELKRENRRRRQSVVTVLSIAASLVLILGMGTLLSSASPAAGGGEGNETIAMAGGSGAASLLSSNSALGYIIMGILAFLLGVCVTVLLYRLRGMNRGEREGKDVGEDG